MASTYKIMKYFKDQRPPKRVKSGLTLEQAMTYCQDPITHDPKGNWFCGFTEVE